MLPKYLALIFDRFYETPHGVDEDLASIRAGSGIKGGALLNCKDTLYGRRIVMEKMFKVDFCDKQASFNLLFFSILNYQNHRNHQASATCHAELY